MKSFLFILRVLSLACLSGAACAQTLDELVTATQGKYQKIVVAGKFPDQLKPLQTQLEDKDPSVRIKAVRSLALIGGPMSALLLTPAMDDGVEKSTAVRIEAAKGLGDIGGRQALDVLGIGVLDRNPAVRRYVLESLRSAASVFAVPYIQIALQNDRSLGVRLEAVRMLRKIGTQFSVKPLQEALLNDRNAGIRKAAADALGEVGKKERQVARYLGAAYRRERNVGVKLEIIGSLGLVRDRAGLPYLQEAMQDRNSALRARATQVYGRILGLQ